MLVATAAEDDLAPNATDSQELIKIKSLLATAAKILVADAWLLWDGFVQLVPGEVARLPPTFIPTADMPSQEWFAHTFLLTGSAAPLGCHFVRDATITGHGYVFLDDHLLVQDVYLHGVAVEELKTQPHLLPSNAGTRQVRTIDQPVLEILGPGSPVYGHWLVDFLPRAAIARETLGAAFDRMLIPLPNDLPEWTLALLEKFTGFKRENAVRYDPATEFLLCRKLCIPTFGHGSQSYFFHSFVRDFYTRFRKSQPDCRTRRICLSRRNFEHQTRGVLKGFKQRLYLETAAQARGLEIICPEELSFDQQVELFSNVGLVVGEFGSALHNTLFSAPRTIVGSVRYPNAVQTRIAGLMGQDVVYLIPDEETTDERGAEIYSVGEDKIDRFLDQLLDLHARSFVS